MTRRRRRYQHYRLLVILHPRILLYVFFCQCFVLGFEKIEKMICWLLLILCLLSKVDLVVIGQKSLDRGSLRQRNCCSFHSCLPYLYFSLMTMMRHRRPSDSRRLSSRCCLYQRPIELLVEIELVLDRRSCPQDNIVAYLRMLTRKD